MSSFEVFVCHHCTAIVTIAIVIYYNIVYVTRTRKSRLINRLIVSLYRHVVAVEKRNGINHLHVRFLNVSGRKRSGGDGVGVSRCSWDSAPFHHGFGSAPKYDCNGATRIRSTLASRERFLYQYCTVFNRDCIYTMTAILYCSLNFYAPKYHYIPCMRELWCTAYILSRLGSSSIQFTDAL